MATSLETEPEMTLGEMLKELRLAKGYSGPQLAKAVGICRASYWEYENTERMPSLVITKAILTALDSNWDCLNECELPNDNRRFNPGRPKKQRL